MNIKTKYDNLAEYRRVIFTCLQIVRGFYQSKRYFLTNKLLENENRQVILPDLPFNDVPKFWGRLEELAREKYTLNIETLAQNLKSSGIEIPSLNQDELDNYTKGTTKFLEQAVKDLVLIFPQLKEKEFDIEIIPTLYGTGGSFERAQITDSKVSLSVTSRVDKDKSHLLEVILSSIIYAIKYSKNKVLVKWQNDWEINESLVDFLLQNTLLSKHAANYSGTMDVVESNETNYLNIIENSKNIFAKLGYPLQASLLVEDEVIKINGQLPKKSFSDSEQRIIKHFIAKKDHLVTNDELQDVLWQGNYDKYSLWALAKTIQRIREKIKFSGISSEIIQTVRGKGYLIYD